MKRILPLCLLAIAALTASAQSQRERIPFDDNWQFAFGNGDPAFQYDERPEDGAETISITTFNGLAQVILQKQ